MVPTEQKQKSREENKKQDEMEMEEFLGKLKISSLMEIVGIISKGGEEGAGREGQPVYVTLKPPETYSTGMIGFLQKLLDFPDLNGHDICDLYKHADLYAFGSIYSFGDGGLFRSKNEKPPLNQTVEGSEGSEGSDKPVAYFAGVTTKTEQEFHAWLIKNWKKYRASAYSAGDHNCLHFIDEALDFLEVSTPSAVRKILKWIRHKGAEFLNRLSAQSRPAAPGASGSGSGSNRVINFYRGMTEVIKMKWETQGPGSSSSSSFSS